MVQKKKISRIKIGLTPYLGDDDFRSPGRAIRGPGHHLVKVERHLRLEVELFTVSEDLVSQISILENRPNQLSIYR